MQSVLAFSFSLDPPALFLASRTATAASVRSPMKFAKAIFVVTAHTNISEQTFNQEMCHALDKSSP
eukprot:SAG31_NODE_135_length_23206_cov_25.707967_27_plen_66_part_00